MLPFSYNSKLTNTKTCSKIIKINYLSKNNEDSRKLCIEKDKATTNTNFIGSTTNIY